jgi:hypothetical protein
MKRVRVAADRWNFELDGTGEFISPIGGNILNDEHPVQGTLFRHFDARDCDRRFGLMAELGLNCLRQAIGVNEVFDPKSGLKAQGLNNWDTFIGLAEKHGVYLMPVGGYLGGNDWFDVEKLADHGRSLDESCAFWEAFVGHYAGHPAIWAWDLRNELLYWTRPHSVPAGSPDSLRIEAMLRDRWPKWLETRYGSVAAMNRAYGASYASFADVPGSIEFIERPFDLCAYDFRCYLNDRGYDWCKRQCEVIRAVSPLHLIVSGNNGWLSPDQNLFLANGFHNRAVHELFDFVTHHPYPAWQAVPDGRGDPLDGGEPLRYWLSACIGMSRLDHYGKPVVIQEFGWYGGGTSKFLCDLPYRSEREHAQYTRTLTDALIPHVNGFVNWPTFDMPGASDISNHGGIFTHDGKRKELTAVFAELAKRLLGKCQVRVRATVKLTYSLLGLYTCRAYQDRMWDEVHQTIQAGQVPDFRFI